MSSTILTQFANKRYNKTYLQISVIFLTPFVLEVRGKI